MSDADFPQQSAGRRVRLGDAMATQALWNLELRAELLARFSARPAADFGEEELGQLHPVETPVGEMVLGYELDDDGRPRADLAEANGVVARYLAGWALADWWTAPSAWLDGAIPLALVEDGEHDRVRDAARRLVADWAEPPATSADPVDDFARVRQSFPGGPRGFTAWLDHPRGELGGRTPRQALADGDVELVVVVAEHLAK